MPSYVQIAEDLRPNPEQWAAYESQTHTVVLAGPGSGKTKLLTTKLARVCYESPQGPRRPACVTYSNECVREIRRRLQLVGVRPDRDVFVGTVHSFCMTQILRPFGSLVNPPIPMPFRIATDKEQDSCLRSAIGGFGRNQDPSWFRTEVDKYRRTRLDRDMPEWREDEELANIIEEYERQLRSQGLLDFDDVILKAAAILRSSQTASAVIAAKYPFFAVDEYQDLGLSLHRIVEQVCFGSGATLFAVGDPDQSIYGFTGAVPETLLRLAERNDVVPVRLKRNYRSGRAIVTASEVVLGEVRGYSSARDFDGAVVARAFPEGFRSQCDGAATTLLQEIQRARQDAALGGVAVLYPTRIEGAEVAAAFDRAGVAYVRNDRGAPYPRTRIVRWIEDACLWCSGNGVVKGIRWGELVDRFTSLLGRGDLNQKDTDVRVRQEIAGFLWTHRNGAAPVSSWILDFQRTFVAQLTELSHESPDEIASLETVHKNSLCGVLSAHDVTRFGFSGGSPNAVNLLTLHSAKGLEFDSVIIVGMDEGQFPRYDASDDMVKEQRRLFFVGVSRARRHVVLVYSGFTQNKWGTRFHRGPSRFVSELLERGAAR